MSEDKRSLWSISHETQLASSILGQYIASTSQTKRRIEHAISGEERLVLEINYIKSNAIGRMVLNPSE